MNDTDYDEKKFDKDEYGNLIPREDVKYCPCGFPQSSPKEHEHNRKDD